MREYNQYPYQQGNSSNHYDQYHYDTRRSPIHKPNRYEVLREHREEESHSFLDQRRRDRTPPWNERTPPRNDRMGNTRSPIKRGDAEEESRSKRKRE